MKITKTVPFFLIIALFSQCETKKNAKNRLIISENWRTETLEFPLQFAPSLQYSGFENVCFAPGWGKKEASDYFSCAFLWVIDQNPKLSAKKLELDMQTYFDGLMHAVAKTESNPSPQIPKAKAFFEKVNDTVYVGKLITYDSFTTKKELKLNVVVNYKSCKQEKEHLIFFAMSPQALEHPIWKKMKKIAANLICS